MCAVAEGGFPLHINYDISLSQLLGSGGYDWSEQEINHENFPCDAKGEIDVEMYLISFFGRGLTFGEISAALRDEQLRPLTLLELLTFGATHPGKQLEFPIAGLGSVWKDNNGIFRVPYLSSSPGQKRYCLLWQYDTWVGCFRFAAVHSETTTRETLSAKAEMRFGEAASGAISCRTERS